MMQYLCLFLLLLGARSASSGELDVLEIDPITVNFSRLGGVQNGDENGFDPFGGNETELTFNFITIENGSLRNVISEGERDDSGVSGILFKAAGKIEFDIANLSSLEEVEAVFGGTAHTDRLGECVYRKYFVCSKARGDVTLFVAFVELRGGGDLANMDLYSVFVYQGDKIEIPKME